MESSDFGNYTFINEFFLVVKQSDRWVMQIYISKYRNKVFNINLVIYRRIEKLNKPDNKFGVK